jgi:predicted ATP-dependent endonuclease of OLD family
MNERTDVSTVRGRLFYLKQSEPEVFRELTAQLMAAFPEIKSVDVRLNTDEGVFEFILTEDIPVNGHSIEAQYDAADVGLGMQNLLILVANILLLKPSVVLMDEPDVHMHPALVRDFVRIIKQLSQQTQFFITTHNIAFIDALAPEDIFTVVYRPEEKGSVIRPVAERNEVLDTLQNLGFNLSNSILSGKPKVYVFVEGNSDATYLLHFAQRLGYAKSVTAFNVEFVPMNGKGERFKMLRLLERLGMIETPFFMVLDQDETSPEEMGRLRTTYFARHPERLIYWSKRQIENYLLDIPTLQQLVHKELSKKASMDSSAKVDSFNVSSVLHRLAEEQSELIRERWLREMFVDESFLSREMLRNTYKAVSNMPLDEAVTEFNAELIKYFAKNSMRLSKVSESAIQQFQAKWDDPQTRLDMCDGRKLLTALQRELQEHFHCSFSNSEIISAMPQESIHTDIRTLLDALHILITTF